MGGCVPGILGGVDAGDVCFVILFRSILPAAPTECDVLIVRRQHNDKEWKFKEQHAKMWENIAWAKRYSRPCGFNVAVASAAAVPTPVTDHDRVTQSFRFVYGVAN